MNTNPNDGAYPAPTALANSGPKERQEAFDALKEELDDALAELAALRAERDALKTTLLVCARQAEALKRDCGMDDEAARRWQA